MESHTEDGREEPKARTELRCNIFISEALLGDLFSLMLELEALPLPALLLPAHGMMWSSHTLISKKLYRLPHYILEPFSKELRVGIGCESSRRYFCNLPANSLGTCAFPAMPRGLPTWRSGTVQMHVCPSRTRMHGHTETHAQPPQRSIPWGLEPSSGNLPERSKVKHVFMHHLHSGPE